MPDGGRVWWMGSTPHERRKSVLGGKLQVSEPQLTSKPRRWRREQIIASVGLVCALLCVGAWIGSLFGTVGVLWVASDAPPSSTDWAGIVVPNPAPVGRSVDLRVLAGSICLCRQDNGLVNAIVFDMVHDEDVIESMFGPGSVPTKRASLWWLSESLGAFWELTPVGVEDRIDTALWLPRATPSARLSPLAHSGPRFDSLVAVPLWMLAVVFAAPSVLLLRQAGHQRRRASIGNCFACGYDLSGLPKCPGEPNQPPAIESGLRCPECGETGRSLGTHPAA